MGRGPMSKQAYGPEPTGGVSALEIHAALIIGLLRFVSPARIFMVHSTMTCSTSEENRGYTCHDEVFPQAGYDSRNTPMYCWIDDSVYFKSVPRYPTAGLLPKSSSH